VLRIAFLLTCVSVLVLAGASSNIAVLNLRQSNGSVYKVQTSGAPATVVVFVSSVCPVSMAYSERLSALAGAYSRQGVRMLLVNSNRNEEDAAVEKQRVEARISMPVYRDDGALADLVGAAATPTAVLFDKTGAIRYFGMIDNSRNPARVTKHLLQSAIDAVLAGREVEISRTKVIGCAIKSAL
jgi:DNA-binding LacI/PurR family transcriptional regulator